MQDDILVMEGITKIYPNGFVANEGVTLSVRKGEIHALLGENGAGKTTLMNVLFGLQTPEKGQILLEGKKVEISNPLDAISHGIGMVHQHFKLVPSLSVAENIMLGVEPRKRLGIFDLKEAMRITKEIADKYNMPIDPQEKIMNLSVGNKQKVEILKVLVRGAKILVLDEPTAVLTPQETAVLFKELKMLRDDGRTIIFISHKLDEVMEICDRCTILQNGRLVGTDVIARTTPEKLSCLMVGRDVDLRFEKPAVEENPVKIQVQNLTCSSATGRKLVDDVSFTIRGGEILGIAAVEGNGQNEVAEMIAGLRTPGGGAINYEGCSTEGKTIRQLREMGLAHIPEDRNVYGTAGTCPVKENLISDRYYKPAFSKGFFLKSKEINGYTDQLIKEFLIKCDGREEDVGMLSGGNVQKVVVAREFTSGGKIVVANQPTRGVDIGAAEFIRKRLVDLSRKEKAAVLLISADLTELLTVSDKIMVMYGGKVTAYFPETAKLTDMQVGEYMLGLKKQTPKEVRCAIH